MDDLWDLANDLLDAVAARMAATLGAVETPYRQFVTLGDGPVTHEPCPQLSVRFVRGFRGTADEENVAEYPIGASIWSATFAVEVVRCWPSKPPSPTSPLSVDDIDLAAQKLLRDAWLLMVGLAEATTAESWLARCEGTVLGPVQPTGDPSGGAHGVQCFVTAEILSTGGLP